MSDFLARFKKAETDSLEWHSTYEEIYQCTMPNRNLYDGIQNGQRKTQKIFDATPVMATRGFVNSLVNTVTPAFTKWFELGTGPFIAEEQKEAIQEALNKGTEIFFAMLNKSNFDTEQTKCYYDLSAGTATLLFEESDEPGDPFSFTAIPPIKLGLEAGVRGSIGGSFEKAKIQNNLIKETWPDIKIPTGLAAVIKQAPVEKSEFKIGIYKEKKDKQGRAWVYRVYFGDDEVVKRRFFDNPYITFRWNVLSGELFGRGPVMDVLPDIKSLHKIREMSLKANEIRTMGMWTVADNDIVNPAQIKIRPGTFLKVSRNGGPMGPSIDRLPDIGNPQISEVESGRLQNVVKQGMLDNRISTETAQDSTAFAVQQLMSFYKSDLAAPFGRIMNEFMYPFVRRGLGILIRKGLWTMPALKMFDPETGEETEVELTAENVDSLFVAVNILSPIAKIQKSEEVQIANQGVAAAAKLSPDTLPLDVMGYQKWVMDNAGVPEEFTYDKEEIKTQQAEAQANASEQPV